MLAAGAAGGGWLKTLAKWATSEEIAPTGDPGPPESYKLIFHLLRTMLLASPLDLQRESISLLEILFVQRPKASTPLAT